MNIFLIWLLLFGPFDPVIIPDYPAAVVPIIDLQPIKDDPGIARIQKDQGKGKAGPAGSGLQQKKLKIVYPARAAAAA